MLHRGGGNGESEDEVTEATLNTSGSQFATLLGRGGREGMEGRGVSLTRGTEALGVVRTMLARRCPQQEVGRFTWRLLTRRRELGRIHLYWILTKEANSAQLDVGRGAVLIPAFDRD